MTEDAQLLPRVIRWLNGRRDLQEALYPPTGMEQAYDPLITKGDADIVDAAIADKWAHDDLPVLVRCLYTMRGIAPPQDAYLAIVADEAIVRAGTPTPDLDWGRSNLIERLRELLHIPLERVIRHGRENSIWSFDCFYEKHITIGTTAVLTSQTKVRNAVFDGLGIMPPRYKSPDWDRLIEMIGQAAVLVEEEEFTQHGILMSIVTGYMEMQVMHLTTIPTPGEREELLRNFLPFRTEEGVHIHAHHCFTTYCVTQYTPLGYRDLLAMLRAYGAYRKTWALNTKNTSRSYWFLPNITPILDTGHTESTQDPDAVPPQDASSLEWLEREGIIPPDDNPSLSGGDMPF